MNTALIGVWVLSSFLTTSGEITFIGEEPEKGGVERWLYGNNSNQLNKARPITGLKLTIKADGSFSESRFGNPKFSWFNQEGVLDDKVTPFNGVLKMDGSRAYLHLAVPVAWANPTEAVRLNRVRYDDGDTIICDNIEVKSGYLIRTISVVTDEMYFDRTTLIYKKADK